MGIADLLMPKLGLTMTEGQIAAWSVAPGQRFAKGDILVTVETDKIASEVEASRDGMLVEQLVAEGTTVAVGIPIARWSAETGSDAPVSAAAATPSTPPVDPPAVRAPSHEARSQRASGDRVIATPLARRRAAAAGIDLGTVCGSGPGGRIKAGDLSPGDGNGAQASEFFQLRTEVEASAIMALAARIDSEPLLASFVLLAIAKALQSGNADHIGQNAINLGVSVDGEQHYVAMHGIAGRSLTAIDRDIRAIGQRQHKGDGVASSVSLTILDAPRVAFIAPPVAPGCRGGFGLGAVKNAPGIDADGVATMRPVFDLSFAGAPGWMALDRAAQLLAAIGDALEDPLLLIA